MKAGWFEEYGVTRDVVKVGHQPDPAPQPGEVLVRVEASGVNPSDEKRISAQHLLLSSDQSGGYGGSFPLQIPLSDGAGVIEAVGDGVDKSRVGERVWLWNAQWERAFGAAAEYTALPSEQAVQLPDSVDFVDAANLGIPALAAHYSVFCDGPVEGRTVLVTGGAGVVGRYAIQMAKWGGATVIATVSNDAKATLARSAGADQVIDYRTEDVAELVLAATSGAGVHRIVEVDFGGNLAVTLKVLGINGVVSAYGSAGQPAPVVPFYTMMFKGHTLRAPVAYTLPEAHRKKAIEDVNQMMSSGVLTHNIGRIFPLDELAGALEHVVDPAKVGSVVVNPT
ncbi:NADPH:quinone reductase [Mycolicibacterium stellerae]|uniref:NADPH:quinone reductase n=1 Tax=Mycolicibacterium stellerae TaxID=2358193 RepID=UPI000F0BD1E4|nr:NADPH:quinone reductase [Mycolicibacterium stellerae]